MEKHLKINKKIESIFNTYTVQQTAMKRTFWKMAKINFDICPERSMRPGKTQQNSDIRS